VTRSKYAQHVLDIIGSSPAKCMVREALIEAVAKATGEPEKRVKKALTPLLKRMVLRGLIVRKDGYYCLGADVSLRK